MADVNLPSGFRYERRSFLRWGQWEHRWVAEGAHGACELWIRVLCDKVREMDPLATHSGGFEVHSVKPNDHRAPDHGECTALSGRPCWHDGSSTYATESWIPMFERGATDEEILRRLAGEYRRRFIEEAGDG